MSGAGCCGKLGDDLKNTRSCDSTPARTVDCIEKESIVCQDARYGPNTGRSYHDRRCLISLKFALYDSLCFPPHDGILPFEKNTLEGHYIRVCGLGPAEGRILAGPRIMGTY